MVDHLKSTRAQTHSKALSIPSVTSQEDIAKAAYYLAEKRGFVPGHELEDWLKAEYHLKQHTAVDTKAK